MVKQSSIDTLPINSPLASTFFNLLASRVWVSFGFFTILVPNDTFKLVHPSKTSFTNIYTSVSFKVFSVYNEWVIIAQFQTTQVFTPRL